MARTSKSLQNLKEALSAEELLDEEKLIQMDIDKDFILKIEEEASVLTDKRETKDIIHSLESILLTVIFGIMANCNTFVEIYLFMQKRSD